MRRCKYNSSWTYNEGEPHNVKINHVKKLKIKQIVFKDLITSAINLWLKLLKSTEKEKYKIYRFSFKKSYLKKILK